MDVVDEVADENPIVADTVLQVAELHPLSRLRTLSLSGCACITDSGLEVAQQLPYLSRLDVSGCPVISDAGLAALTEARSLVSLKLDDCKRVSPRSLPTPCSSSDSSTGLSQACVSVLKELAKVI